jgi:hypothetical protein
MPDAEMSEDINVRMAGQATSPGLVVYHVQRGYAGSHSFAQKNPQTRRKRPLKMREALDTSQSGEVAGRLLSTGAVPKRTQDSGQL